MQYGSNTEVVEFNIVPKPMRICVKMDGEENCKKAKKTYFVNKISLIRAFTLHMTYTKRTCTLQVISIQMLGHT